MVMGPKTAFSYIKSMESDIVETDFEEEEVLVLACCILLFIGSIMLLMLLHRNRGRLMSKLRFHNPLRYICIALPRFKRDRKGSRSLDVVENGGSSCSSAFEELDPDELVSIIIVKDEKAPVKQFPLFPSLAKPASFKDIMRQQKPDKLESKPRNDSPKQPHTDATIDNMATGGLRKRYKSGFQFEVKNDGWEAQDLFCAPVVSKSVHRAFSDRTTL